MKKERISITLEKGLKEKIEKIIEPYGGKFSTFIEKILKDCVREQK